MNNFTAKQREIVARKLGYDGPMQGFDDFLNSSPALEMKYATLSDKFAERMAKGGMVRKKYAVGGAVTDQQVRQYLSERPGLSDQEIRGAMEKFGVSTEQMARATGVNRAEVQQRFNAADISDQQVKQYLSERPGLTDKQIAAEMDRFGVDTAQMSRATGIDQAAVQQRYDAATKAAADAAAKAAADAAAKAAADKAAADLKAAQDAAAAATTAAAKAAADKAVADAAAAKAAADAAAKAAADAAAKAGKVTAGTTTKDTTVGAPNIPTATTYTATQTTTPIATTAPTVAAVEEAAATSVAAPTAVAKPDTIAPQTITAASTQADVKKTLDQLQAASGVISEAAKAIAATQEPATTAVAGTQAAQGVAGTVQGAPTRVAQAGEMVAGPAVDMARAEQVMAQTQAAQGVVTEEMTVQGQLNRLLNNFDAGNPPPWAAASMRTATAQLAARGLGASSLAGQAIIQATLEAATPIAAADAKVFETMGLQNLSNRQQTAMLVGQQRAAFLGQEFDQAFQTRVLNAARVADIANKNFDAQTQIAIENSRLASTMDVANLSARNAVVLSKMAQMSQIELTNLSNRQQVAVENARAFLTMDLKNLDNKQQTAIFKAQEMNDALISDAGFANAASITNAQNKLEADKVSAQLAASAAQFNAEMKAKVDMANAAAANELAKFNAQQANAREQFNAEMKSQIDIANAKILAEVSMANTAATNAANAVNAKNATDLSAAAYAQQSQTYRDLLEMSWKTGESEKDRATNIVAATLSANASTNAATTTANSSAISNIAKAGITLLANYDKVKSSAGSILSDLGFD